MTLALLYRDFVRFQRAAQADVPLSPEDTWEIDGAEVGRVSGDPSLDGEHRRDQPGAD